MLVAYFMLTSFGWPLSQYEQLPIRERELTKGLVIKHMEAIKRERERLKAR